MSSLAFEAVFMLWIVHLLSFDAVSDVMNYALTCIWSCLMLWIMHLLAFDAAWCYELCVNLRLKLSDAMNCAFTCLWNCLMLWIMHLLCLKLSDAVNFAFTCLWNCLMLWIMHSLAFEALWFNQSYLHLPLKPSHARCQSTCGTLKHPSILNCSDFVIPTWSIVSVELVTKDLQERDP